MFLRTRRWLKRQHDSHKACVYETLGEALRQARTRDKKKDLKALFGRKWIGWWCLLAVIIALSVVLSVYHDKIVVAIRPFSEKILNTPATWLVPVALLIVLSIPPLVGHEIIIIVTAVIWGLWLGFAIAVAGTFLGEILCYYIFKHGFRARAAKIEAKSKMYADLANIMRDKGLWMITLVRFSALPGHITTAIQSTIGISVWVFGIAVAISLPKQLALVYLGVLFGESRHTPGESGAADAVAQTASRKHTVITWTVLILTGWLTFVAFYIIWYYIWLANKAEAAKAAEAAQTATLSSSASALDDKDPADVLVHDSAAGPSAPSIHYASLPFHSTPGEGKAAGSYSNSFTSQASSEDLRGANVPLAGGRSRSGTGRSHSGTVASSAFSNDSTPYLPYTPIPDPSNVRLAPGRLPSPVPSRSSADGEEIEMLPPSHSDSNDSHPRFRKVRLARSNSDLAVPSVHVSTSDESLENFGNLAPSPMATVSGSGSRSRSQQRSSTLSISALPTDASMQPEETEAEAKVGSQSHPRT